MKRIAMIAGGLLLVQAAHAGVYVELVRREAGSTTSELSQKMYVQNGSGRFVDDGGRVSLIKGESMYVIDDSDKTYLEFDKATMQQIATQLNAAMERMKEQLAKLPPEQRAQMEQMMGGALGGKPRTVEVTDTGKSDTVDGRKCKLWDVARDGQLDEQICVAPYASLPGKEDFRAVFAKFARIFEEMAKSVPMLSGMMTNEFSAHAKTDGFPVRSRAYENGQLTGRETTVQVWREETIPASMFDVPAGYTRKQLPMGPGM
jgi:hypothetical protein